jgi:hypothetical protein
LKSPVPNRRRGEGAPGEGTYQPNGNGTPRYIPMQRLDLDGVRRSVIVGLAIAFLIPVAVAVWALTQIGGSSSNNPAEAAGKPGAAMAHGSTMAHHPAMAANYRQSTLFKALAGANQSQFAKGLLPPSSCTAMSAAEVMCKQPHYAVNEVIFRTYPSAKALYAAYESRVEAIGQAQFRANYGNCTETAINGEIGWNHDFKHPSYYPVSMFTSGMIKDDQAAGRMFCTFSNGLLYLVWTQDDGRLLGELAGTPHLDAYLWWHNVHHVIPLPGSANAMANMTAMPSKADTSSGMSKTTSTSSAMPKTTSTMSGMSK